MLTIVMPCGSGNRPIAPPKNKSNSNIRSSQNTVTLISPNRGTGKLKEGVHAYLKRHDRIAKFEPAEKYDGGAGVTVAYPK